MRVVQQHIHNHAPAVPSRIDVHEHRAPTAETAKLLSELEAEAQRRIEASIKLDHSLFDCRVFVVRKADVTSSLGFIMLYRMGPNPTPGREPDYAAMTRVEYVVQLWNRPTMDQIVAGLITALSESVARTMLNSCGEDLMRQMANIDLRA